MAKTKLMERLNLALGALEGEIEAAQDETKGRLQPVGPETEKRLKQRFEEAEAAAQILQTHLDNLKRREAEPTVKDRIRNLKNVFKDQAELKKRRQEFRDRLAAMQKDLKERRLDVNEKAKGLGEMYASVRLKWAKQSASGSSGGASGVPSYFKERLLKLGYSDRQTSTLISSSNVPALWQRALSMEKDSMSRLSSFENLLNEPFLSGWTPTSSATDSLRARIKSIGYSDVETNEFLKSRDLKQLKESLRQLSESQKARSAGLGKLVQSAS